MDCIVCAHPSLVTKEDIDGYGSVPVQFLAPEVDRQFSDEMKMHAFQKLVGHDTTVLWKFCKLTIA